MNVLVTGGSGLVGRQLVKSLLELPGCHVYVIDINEPVEHIDGATFIKKDVRNSIDCLYGIDINHIFHLAGQSNIDLSISDPDGCVQSNLNGTLNVLLYALTCKNLQSFHFLSTAQVFGTKMYGWSDVEDEHRPSNLYASTKSMAEQLCRSFENIYSLPLVITRSSNIEGVNQDPSRFIPTLIRNIRNGTTVQIYADGNTIGSRSYVAVEDVADWFVHLIRTRTARGTFHITGDLEVDNLMLAEDIAAMLGVEFEYKLVNINNMVGHDLRYALCDDSSKLLKWAPRVGYRQLLQGVVNIK